MRFVSEKMEYFFNMLDGELRNGKEPEEALRKAVESYAYVFYNRKGARELYEQKMHKEWVHPDNR